MEDFEMGFAVQTVRPLDGKFTGELVSLDHASSRYKQEPQLRWRFCLTDKALIGTEVDGYTGEKFLVSEAGEPLNQATEWATAILGGTPPDDMKPSTLYHKRVTLVLEARIDDSGRFRSNKVVSVLHK